MVLKRAGSRAGGIKKAVVAVVVLERAGSRAGGIKKAVVAVVVLERAGSRAGGVEKAVVAVVVRTVWARAGYSPVPFSTFNITGY